jgi:hypothetical protein
MVWRDSGASARILAVAVFGAGLSTGPACGSSTSGPDTNGFSSGSSSGAATGSSGGSSGAAGSGTSGSSSSSSVYAGSSSSGPTGGSSSSSSGSARGSSSSGSGSGSGSGGGDEGGASGAGSSSSGSAGDDGGGSSSSSGASSSGGSSSGAAACVKGQVPASKVVMIGDSYLDPTFSNAATDLFALAQGAGSLPANTTYRHYYLGGAAMNNGALGLNIPYQYENQAKTDIAVTNPASIDTIIMDGGGNDILIDQQSCLTNPPPGNAACTSAITGAINRAGSLMQEMASNGVKHIVYFFYPHLDPAGGGLLPTPSPDVNVTLDYAAPLAQQVCCGTTFTPAASTTSSAPYTCKGTTSGTDCIFVDIRPAFEGHTSDYIKSGTGDHVHPSPAGAQVIANLVWQTMVDNCIAQ